MPNSEYDISIWEQGFVGEETTEDSSPNEKSLQSSEEWQFTNEAVHLNELMMKLHDQDMESGTSIFYNNPMDAMFYGLRYLKDPDENTPAPNRGLVIFCLNRLEEGDGGAFAHAVEVMHDPERSKEEHERMDELEETYDFEDVMSDDMVQVWKYRMIPMGQVQPFGDREWMEIGAMLDALTSKFNCTPPEAMKIINKMVTKE